MGARKHQTQVGENPDKVQVAPLGDADMATMKLVLELKLAQHPEIGSLLMLTGSREIVEDATRRQRGSGLF
ncbi:hypothetical protein LCGC14_2875350, partial [marine sediment metagenome]